MTTTTAEPVEQTDPPVEPNREAATYRTRLRDAEARLEAMTAQLDAARNAALAEVLAGDIALSSGRAVRLAEPDDLTTLGGFDAATAWREDGTLDRDAVTTAVAALVDARPELLARRGPILPDPGKTPDVRTDRGAWAAAFGPHQD